MPTEAQIKAVREHLRNLTGGSVWFYPETIRTIADMLREPVPETEEELVLEALKAHWPYGINFEKYNKDAMRRALAVLQRKHVEDVKNLLTPLTRAEVAGQGIYCAEANPYVKGFNQILANRFDNYINPPKPDPAVEAVIAMGCDKTKAEQIVAAVRNADAQKKG